MALIRRHNEFVTNTARIDDFTFRGNTTVGTDARANGELAIRSSQVEGPDDKNRHLRARDRIIRTVVIIATATGNVLNSQLFDKAGAEAVYADIVEYARWRRRCESGAMLRPQQKDGHLRARDRIIRAVVIVTAAAGDALKEKLLDERSTKAICAHIVKYVSRRRRRHETAAMDAAFEEYRHLGPGHQVFWAVVTPSAAAGDAGGEECFDERESKVTRWHVVEGRIGQSHYFIIKRRRHGAVTCQRHRTCSRTTTTATTPS